MKKRKWLIIISSFLFIALIGYSIMDSYGLFESNITSPVISDLAKWQILVNTEDITGTNNSFTVPQVNWETNSLVAPGKAAPGMSAYFEIIINPSETEVSIEYEISLDFANLNNDKIYITSVKNKKGEDLNLNEEGNYLGIIPLLDIQNNETETIRVDFTWENDDENSDVDSSFVGMDDAFLDVPISIRFLQHIGE